MEVIIIGLIVLITQYMKIFLIYLIKNIFFFSNFKPLLDPKTNNEVKN